MVDFNVPMGGLPEGYGSLLYSADSQLVRMPDGTYAQAPRAFSPANMYAGTYPPPSPGLTSRSVPTVPIDSNGNPIIPSQRGPSLTALMNSRDRFDDKPLPEPTWQEKFTAATGQPLVAAPGPAQNPFDFFAGMFSNKTPQPSQSAQNGGVTPNKDETRLGYAGTGMFPYPEDNPALDAIDQLTGSGGNTAFPRPLPGDRRPMVPPPVQGSAFRPGSGWGSNGFTYSWMNQDQLGGANALPDTYLAGNAPPPLPKARPNPPMPPAGSITFKAGDTVGKLAKARGMTVSSFADLYGIANPNKIYAGQTVSPQGPAMPRMPPAGLNRAPPQVPMPRLPPAALNRARQIAEGKASQLDQFGMIL